MTNDVILNKVQIIEHCIRRIKEVYNNDPENLHNFTKQDSIILNIQRSCEAAIDLAMHIVADKKLGIPQNSREAFELLQENDIVDESLASSLIAMVGFRNIAIHDYQELNLHIIQSIIEKNIYDVQKFGQFMIQNEID